MPGPDPRPPPPPGTALPAAAQGTPPGRPAALGPLLLLGAAALALHLATAARLGPFMDELYLIDCSGRLDSGYVDMPPLAPLLVRAVRETLGDSLLALRVVPALGHAFTVGVVGMLAAVLGGGRFAQILAVGFKRDPLAPFFRRIDPARNPRILVCRRPRRPLPEMWPDLKAYLHR